MLRRDKSKLLNDGTASFDVTPMLKVVQRLIDMQTGSEPIFLATLCQEPAMRQRFLLSLVFLLAACGDESSCPSQDACRPDVASANKSQASGEGDATAVRDATATIYRVRRQY